MPTCFSLLDASPTQLDVATIMNHDVSDEPLVAIMPRSIDGRLPSQIVRSDEVLVVSLADVLNDALSSPDRQQTSAVLGIMQHLMRLYAEIPSQAVITKGMETTLSDSNGLTAN